MTKKDNTIEQKTMNKYFLIGGFMSGAKYPWGSQIFTTFDSIKESGVEFQEHLFNSKNLTPLEIVTIPYLYQKNKKRML